MKTYIVSEIDYWGGAPLIKIDYAGDSRTKAIEVFDKRFKQCTWNTDTNEFFMLPSKVEKYVGEKPSYELVINYLAHEFDEKGLVRIDDEWDDGEGDYPLYLEIRSVNN